MLPYILKICGFKNSTVYRFYSMYQKYRVLVKLYICGLTYRSYIRYRHNLRIDVITYVPTLANDSPSAAVCLPPLRIIVVVPAVPGIATSGHQDVLLHRRYGLLRFGGGSQQGSPVGFVGWDPSCWGGSVVGSLLRWVARKNFIAKSPTNPSRNPQMMGVAQRGRLKFLKMSFWRII